MNRHACLLLIVLLVGLSGCAAKKDAQEPLPPVPMPPQATLAAAPEKELPALEPLEVTAREVQQGEE